MHVIPRYLALGLLYCSAGASAHPPPAVFFFWKAHPERYSRRSYAEPDLRIPARVGTAGELAQIKSIWEVPADWEPLNLWEALPRDERVRHMCLRMKRDQETTSCACVWESTQPPTCCIYVSEWRTPKHVLENEAYPGKPCIWVQELDAISNTCHVCARLNCDQSDVAYAFENECDQLNVAYVSENTSKSAKLLMCV